MVYFSTVQYSAVPNGTIECFRAPYNTLQQSISQHILVQYSSTIQCHAARGEPSIYSLLYHHLLLSYLPSPILITSLSLSDLILSYLIFLFFLILYRHILSYLISSPSTSTPYIQPALAFSSPNCLSLLRASLLFLAERSFSPVWMIVK